MRNAILLCLAATLVATGVWADTVAIPGDHPTISAALAAINRTDGTPDIINVNAATITESVTIAIAPSDELTINGDADANGNCVVVFSAIDQGYGLIARAATGENVTINDLTLIPSYAGVGLNSFTGAGMLLDDAGVDTGTVTIQVNNCVVSSSSTGEVANDPTAVPPSDYTYWNGSAVQFMYGIRVDDTHPSSEIAFELNNCIVGHGNNRGFYIRNDQSSTCTMTACEAHYSGAFSGAAGAFTGIRSFDMNGTWILNDCVSSNNRGDHAFETGSGVGDVVINGGLFDRGTFQLGGYAMNFIHEGTIDLNGTSSDPIVCIGGPNRGIRFSDPLVQCLGIDYLVLANCGVYGIEVNEWDGTTNPVFNHVGVVECGGILAGTANFDNGDTNTGAVSVTINDSTFTDNGGATNGGVRVRFGADKTINMNRCIFNGVAGQYGIAVTGGSDAPTTIMNATDCAFNPAITQSIAVSATINIVDDVLADPLFASIDYTDRTMLQPTGDFLRPTNEALGAAMAPGGVDILGYSENASEVPVELSIFSAQ